MMEMVLFLWTKLWKIIKINVVLYLQEFKNVGDFSMEYE